MIAAAAACVFKIESPLEERDRKAPTTEVVQGRQPWPDMPSRRHGQHRWRKRGCRRQQLAGGSDSRALWQHDWVNCWWLDGIAPQRDCLRLDLDLLLQ